MIYHSSLVRTFLHSSSRRATSGSFLCVAGIDTSTIEHHQTCESSSARDCSHRTKRPVQSAAAAAATMASFIPHKGALFRVDDAPDCSYGLSLLSGQELLFSRTDFQFASRLFSILDLSTTGVVHRTVVHDFVTQRCPVLARRDAELTTTLPQHSATFDEIWRAVFACSLVQDEEDSDHSYIGMEAWMVLCRLLALAQYLTAQRRFAARHQQNHSSSLIVVDDVPPPAPPVPITADTLLLQYPPTANATTSSMPELDLDHSLLAAHDSSNNNKHSKRASSGTVAIEVFGKKKDLQYLEFAVTYTTHANEVVVRRAMADMEWLDATFRSQKVLGGTLCGRILPPFPMQHAAKESTLEASSSKLQATVTKQIQSATQWMLRGQTTTHRDKTASSTTRSTSGRSSEANITGPERTAHQLERYLRYLMEHPALSTSFPLNAMLTVRWLLVLGFVTLTLVFHSLSGTGKSVRFGCGQALYCRLCLP